MLNRKLLIYLLVAIISFIVGFGARNYLFVRDVVQTFVNPPVKIESTGISDLEIQKVTNLIERFESLQKSRKYTVLDLFTPPTDPKDSQVLDFLMGKDIKMIRMYGTAGLSRQLDWYYIESITKTDNRITVELKELITHYDNSSGGYDAARYDVVMEIVERDGKLLIDKYHHKVPFVEGSLKYEGFY